MADWTDGPEYAPTERPGAFVAPAVAALPQTDQRSAPVSAPSTPPSFVPPDQPTPDLPSLVPPPAAERNPQLAFASTTSAITTMTAGPTPRSPKEPFAGPGPVLTGYFPIKTVVQPDAQLNPPGLPAPAGPWNGAPTSGSANGQPAASIGQVLSATTAWVLVPLLIGMFALPISPVALIVAWVSSAQLKYRRVAVLRSFLIAAPLVGGAGLVNALADPLLGIWEAISFFALIACWILALAVPLTVWGALRNHEPPERA